MPADASKMLGKNFTNFLELMIDEEGNLKLDFEDEIIAGTCITKDGEIMNERVKEIISFEEAWLSWDILIQSFK